MAKFKVGDRVQVVDECGGGKIGDIGTVTSVDGDYYEIDGLSKGAMGLYGHRLELATLRIEAGKSYRTRDGRKVGPVKHYAHITDGYQFEAEFSHWVNESGKGQFGFADLIAEWVDEPAAEQPAKPKFKVGDRVRVTVDRWHEGHRGKLATVKEIIDTYTPPAFTASVDDTDGFAWFFDPEELAPAHTNTAIVCLIENGQPRPSNEPHVHADRTSAAAEAGRLAKKHPGKQFGVYELVETKREEPEHEWQRLALRPWSRAEAVAELMKQSGIAKAAAVAAVDAHITLAA